MARTKAKGQSSTKNKAYKKRHKTDNRRRDIDQIQDDLKKEVFTNKKMEFEIDDDLPGLGQFYCTECARHFADQNTIDIHRRSKLHKRRMKDVAQEQYSHGEAEAGAGKSKEILPPVRNRLV